MDVAEAGDLIAIAGYEAAYAFPGDPEGNPRWTYWAAESRPKPSGYYGADNVMQVVLIDESVTLRGGYNADFTAHAPETYKTVIRPGLSGGAGRGVLIAPFAEVTLEDLIILEGSAAGQGGRQYGSTTYDGGGGVYAIGAAYRSDALIIRNCTIAGNVASSGVGYGGGIYLDGRPDALLEGNDIYGNLAGNGYGQGASEGGGVYVRYSDRVRLTDNLIHDNVASNRRYGQGGGVNLDGVADPTIERNRVISNAGTLDGERALGGGIYLQEVTGGIVSGNVISGNVAGGSEVGAGGGMSLFNSEGVALRRNRIIANVAAYAATLETSGGGGVRIANGCTDIVLENNAIAQNLAPYGGSGVLIALDADYAANVTLRHNTIADNGVPNGRVSASANERRAKPAGQRMSEVAPDGSEVSSLWVGKAAQCDTTGCAPGGAGDYDGQQRDAERGQQHHRRAHAGRLRAIQRRGRVSLRSHAVAWERDRRRCQRHPHQRRGRRSGLRESNGRQLSHRRGVGGAGRRSERGRERRFGRRAPRRATRYRSV